MNCQILIEKYVNDRDETVVKQLGELFLSKKLTLVDFILAIGDYLQTIELSKRTLALTLIANVLRLLPDTFLTTNEIHHLLIFTTAKITEHHILTQPGVDLFGILAKQSALTDEDCMAMMKSIFSDIYVQSLPQTNRYNIFVILLHFLLHRLDIVKQLGSDFVCNFIQSMDGERDPRNLVLCFQCLQYMTKYLDIEPYKEELFEVVACYFPMEYKPKTTNNENEETITHEQLVLSLRNVLTSTGKFAQYCIPMLIEKLESDIPNARLSAMDIFIYCIDEYDARDMTAYLVPIWNLLSKQALCAENQDIENVALQAITALMKLIGKSIQNDQTEISTKKFVDRAIRECENFLKELDLKLVWPATKVLQAVARANPTCASLIWSKIIPLLIKQFENLEQMNHQKTILDMITYFLQPTGIRTIVKLPNDISEQLWILISTYFEKFSCQCLSLIDNLLQLNPIPGQVLEDNLTKYILQNHISEYDQKKLTSILKLLASSALFDRIATNLLTNLVNSWTISKSISSMTILQNCIDLCQNSERCQERLERFFSPSEQFIPLLPNLFKYLSHFYILTNLFTPLFNILVTRIRTDSSARMFVAQCGSIADESCKTFVENLVEQINWDKDREENLFVIIYFLGNLKRKFFQQELEIIFNKIKDKLIENIFDQSSNEIYCYFYGNLINKLTSKPEIIQQVQTLLQQYQTILDQKHIHFWTIIVKSLSLARPSLIEQYLPILIEWINDKTELSDIACQSLKILTNFNDQSFLLTSQSDCLVHPMVKQIVFINIFSELRPFLINNKFSTNQLSVFIDLLNNIPKSILQDDIISLLPILIRALTSSNESIWPSALNSIYDLIKTEPNTIVDYLDTLIPRLINLTVYKDDMSIRITSLKCLKYLTELPIHKIQPYRRQIIHILRTCLDDHKRLVRKQAAETQMSWCLLNA